MTHIIWVIWYGKVTSSLGQGVKDPQLEDPILCQAVKFNILTLGHRITSLISTYDETSLELIRKCFFRSNFGDRMLMTTLCWWPYDSDRFEMMVTESFRVFSMYEIGHHHLKVVSNIRHQHRCHRVRREHFFFELPFPGELRIFKIYLQCRELGLWVDSATD